MTEIPEDVLTKLLEGGLSATTLSSVLDIDLDTVLAAAPPERRREIAADAMLNDAMRMLAWRTIEEAMMILDEGSPDQKMRLIAKFGGDMARVLTGADKDESADMRESLAELLGAYKGAK